MSKRIELNHLGFSDLIELVKELGYDVVAAEFLHGMTVNGIVSEDGETVVVQFTTYEGESALIPALVRELARCVSCNAVNGDILKSDMEACRLLAVATGHHDFRFLNLPEIDELAQHKEG